MNFDLTDERRMLKDGLARFLADHVDPKAIAEGDTGWSRETWEGLAEMGVIGALFTEDQGGFGGAGFDLAVVFEEMGRAGATEPLMEAALAGWLIAQAGRGEIVEGIIAGAAQVALAHGEPGSRYDLTHVGTRAEGGTLTGHKAVVVNGAEADWLVVSARTGAEARDRDGISLYLIPADTDGLQIRDYSLRGGGRAAEITFTDATIPDGALMGDEGAAAELIETATARAVCAQAAEALGLMEHCRDLTVEYLKGRTQFGKPLATFQVLQHRIADMSIEIEQARSAVINLAGHLDSAPEIRDRHVSAAKHTIGTVAKLVVEEAIQMHGGIGMTEEYELAHFARRLTMVDHRFGDATFHLSRFARMTAA